MEKHSKISALGLTSGGLDSILAALILRKQNIDIHWISFQTPFFLPDKSIEAAKTHKIPLILKDITSIFLEMLKNPQSGYGKNMNPCKDCHSLMFNLAGKIMLQKNFNFLFSGEVLGQRPLSQTKNGLRYVEKKSNFKDYIVRPLSGRLLSDNIPILKGWLKKDLLFDISGRSRKKQISLAQEFNIKKYPNPAGGCLLTNKEFSKKLKDILKYNENPSQKKLFLLRYGRHFRINEDMKIIVGRDVKDNENIKKYYDEKKDILIDSISFPSPTILIDCKNEENKKEAVKKGIDLCLSYSNKIKKNENHLFLIKEKNNSTEHKIQINEKSFYTKEKFKEFIL